MLLPERHATPAQSPCKPLDIGDNIFAKLKLERVLSASKYICSLPTNVIRNGDSSPFGSGVAKGHACIRDSDNDNCDLPRKRRKKEAILDRLPHLRRLKYFDLLLIDRVKSSKALLPKQAKNKAKADSKLVEITSNCHELEPKTARKHIITAAGEMDLVVNEDQPKRDVRVQMRDVAVSDSIPLAIYKVTSHGSGLKLRMQRKRTSSDGSSVNSEQYDDNWDSDPTATESSDSSSSRESSTASSEKNWYSSRSRRIPRRRCPCCR